MKIALYQVDAFTDQVFSGNPAAVCPLSDWLSADLMQNIAQENNLSETAFFVQEADHFAIRWFTPTVEVDLCGHATLASAYVIFNLLGYEKEEIVFESVHSGTLKVTRQRDTLTLDFPADDPAPYDLTQDLTDCLKLPLTLAFKGRDDFMLVFENEAQIQTLNPDLTAIARLYARGLIVTAPGDKVDFVSRFFGPQSGVDEDPVTGSAHTTLTPYWAKRLGKTNLTAIQLSKRTGYLICQYLGDRVKISGQAKLYLKGEIYLES